MKQNKASSLLHLFNLHSVVIDVLQATCFKGYIWWNKCFTFLFLLLGELIDLSTWYVVKIELSVYKMKLLCRRKGLKSWTNKFSLKTFWIKDKIVDRCSYFYDPFNMGFQADVTPHSFVTKNGFLADF